MHFILKLHLPSDAGKNMSRVAQAQAYRILGVDIGNSGLRIAELNPINDLETKPGYGPADDPVRMSKRIAGCIQVGIRVRRESPGRREAGSAC